MMTFKALVSSIVLAANLVASPGFSACALTPEASDTIVRGRFVRCEDARFHLEASGAYLKHEIDLEAALARVGPENRETLLERLGDGLLTEEYEARVVVVAVEWHVPIVPWVRGSSEAVAIKGPPQEFRETIRYWWNASIEACETTADWAFVDLWVHSLCCDTPEFGAPACLVRMNYAEPAPDVMSDAISGVLGDL